MAELGVGAEPARGSESVVVEEAAVLVAAAAMESARVVVLVVVVVVLDLAAVKVAALCPSAHR